MPAVTAAHDHELEPRRLLRRVVARVREVQLGDDVVADVGGLREGLHPEGVIGQPRDVEGAGDAAGGEHDVVVGLVHDLVVDRADHTDLGLDVHTDRAARDDPRAVLAAAAQRDGDRLRGQDARGDLGQQGQIELVGERRHQRDVGFLRGQFPLQAANALHSCEACANHQDPRSCHGVHPFCGSRRSASTPYACPGSLPRTTIDPTVPGAVPPAERGRQTNAWSTSMPRRRPPYAADV